MSKARVVRTVIPVPKGPITIYAGKKVADALSELTKDMSVYHGVRFYDLLNAVYLQGRKDGARSVFENVDKLKGQISHRNPGQPSKRKKQQQ